MSETLEGRWLSTREVAQELGLAHNTVRVAVTNGTLPARRVGPRFSLIAAADVEHYRREHLGRVGRPRTGKAQRINTEHAQRQGDGLE